MRDNQDAAPQGEAGRADDAQRFAELIPDWLSGHLPPQTAQWMHAMSEQHPDWAQEAQWMRELRGQVHAHAQTESTDAAWALLQRRLQAESNQAPERPLWQRRRATAAPAGATPHTGWAKHRARLQRWWRNPVWGNALASLALVVVLGHTGWQLGQWQSPASRTDAAPAWRSGALEDLAPVALEQAAVQLPEGVSARQWHRAVAALGEGVQVQPLADGRWLLQLPATHTQAHWRLLLLAQPGMAQAQWQALAGTAQP